MFLPSQDQWWVQPITDVKLPGSPLQVLAVVIVAWISPGWSSDPRSRRSNQIGIAVNRANWSHPKIAVQRAIAQVSKVPWRRENGGKREGLRKKGV